MISQTFRFPLNVALVATVVAVGVIVLALLALAHSQAGTSRAGETDGAMAVDCDASQSGVQSECSYPPGSSFQVEIHVTQPPADGYFHIQAKLGWTEGMVNYQPAAASDEALWSNCTIASRVNTWEL